MKKVVTLLVLSILSVFGVSAATDSLALSADTVKVVQDTVPQETIDLEMSVKAPVLDWGKVSTSRVRPDYMLVPLIFEGYPVDSVSEANVADDDLKLDINNGWLKSSIERRKRVRDMRFSTMMQHPQYVPFNQNDLPEPPKTYVIATDPSKRMVTIEERTYDNVGMIKGDKMKLRNWIHSFNASVQFSQAYLSDNWYQGGENNVNVIGSFVWNVKLNDIIHKKLLFENTVQYKVSVNSAPQDTVRGYSISQDLFQVNTKFGYKAIKNWYYSTNLQFKTQLFNNYKANTYDMNTSFLSPAELNIGVGMTYNTTSKDGKVKFDMSLSPLSMDMNICRDIKKIDPTSFGIEEGKHFKAEYGSNVEGKMTWKVCPEVTWTSRLFAFTNYDHLQGDWENTVDFSINKYLSTRFYAHLRYDNSVAKDRDWKYWQFNEILSFGFNYKFSMN